MAAISLGTALTIGAISSAAGGGARALMQSRAAGKAAKQQAQGAAEANRYMQQGLGQLGQMYSPYINSGMGAIGTLGRLTTPGPGARFASAGPPNQMPQGPTSAQAVPRYGPYAGPYMMAEGGDVMVDRPTLFVAGEAGPERATFKPMAMGPGAAAGPERATFKPMAMGPGAAGRGISDGIRAKLLAKYGQQGQGMDLAMRGPVPDPASLRQNMPLVGGGDPFRQRQLLQQGQGAGGWGGTFAQLAPPALQAAQAMRARQLQQDGAPPPQRPAMIPQWAPEPPQGWGYY